MTGKQNRRQLIAKLYVRHSARARPFLRGKEHRQQIVAAAAIAAPPFDDVVHEPIDLRARGPKPPYVRQRKQVDERSERQDGNLEQARRCLERLAGLIDERPDPGPEERPARNSERQPAHLGGDVDRVCVFVSFALVARERNHRVCVGRETLPVKRRLNDAPLTAVEGAIARQQSVAEQSPRSSKRTPFDEAVLMREQHLLDVVGMVQEKNTQRREPDVDDIAVFGADPQDKRERIAPGLSKAAKKRAAPWPRRDGCQHLTIVAEVIALVLNTASGQMRRAGLRDEIEALCRQAGLDAHIREVREGPKIRAAAREALAANPEAVVAGGGDGTVSAVASVLAGQPVPLGVLPLGTLNHFAQDLRIPIDLEQAMGIIAARRPKRIDVGWVNGCIFVNNSSIGVYPSIVEGREQLRQRGRSKWVALVLASLEVLRRDDELAIRLEADQTKMLARTPFVVVGNNEYLAEGARIGGRLRLDGHQLHAYFAPPVRTRHLPRLVAHALFGRARPERVLKSLAATEMWIDTLFASNVTVACDGELQRFTTPLHYRSWPDALSVLAPDHEDTTSTTA